VSQTTPPLRPGRSSTSGVFPGPVAARGRRSAAPRGGGCSPPRDDCRTISTFSAGMSQTAWDVCGTFLLHDGTACTTATQSRRPAYPDALVAGAAHALALAERFASYATALRAVRRSTPISCAGSRSGSGAWTRTSPAQGPVPSPKVVLAVRNSEGCVAWSHQRGRMVRAQSGRQTTTGERPRSNGCVGARCMDSFTPPGPRSRKA
jgi:hypothetical protein